ncbi:transglutaminase domain-containing protein [Streptomyces natalensis]|uniref:transglutaminase domain-containing protein n=1 Tax=Streptomyces natalensis TaxID=68242 RepID=UPI003B834C74
MLNVALFLEPRSRARRVLVWWGRELSRPYGATAKYRLDYFAECPEPGHYGVCAFRIHERYIVPQSTVGSDGQLPIHSEIFHLRRTWPTLTAPFVELIDEYRDVTFLRLPESLRWDGEFIRRHRVADCAGIANLLVDEGRRRGLAVRFSYGKTLTPPFTAGHYWAEFFVEGVWIPVDPVLIPALTNWGILPAESWDNKSSLGGVLARLTGAPSRPASHGTSEVSSSFRAVHYQPE